MFLALYPHPVKYNEEKRKKKMPHTSTALSADAASGPSILNLMSAADVSFAWITNKCLDFLLSKYADLELYRLLLLLWVSAPHVVLGSRHPVTRHMSRCVTHVTLTWGRRGPDSPLCTSWSAPWPGSGPGHWSPRSSPSRYLVTLDHNINETCDFYNLELIYTICIFFEMATDN